MGSANIHSPLVAVLAIFVIALLLAGLEQCF